MRDLFDLNKSTVINIETQDNYSASFELTAAGDLPFQLVGTVKDTTSSAPIANAYVAVYNEAGDFAAGDYADANGEYAVNLAEEDNYKAIASAAGFAPSEPYTFNIAGQSVSHHFTLTAYSDQDRVIYGKIVETVTAAPIGGARIDAVNSAGDVVATTISIPDGEYSVPYLEMDTYSLIVSKAGYNTKRESVTIELGNTLVEINVELSENTEPTGSTISGYITHDVGTAVPNAWVGLYLLPDEELIQTTSTNDEGYYCFDNVAPGDYVVKSKAVEQ